MTAIKLARDFPPAWEQARPGAARANGRCALETVQVGDGRPRRRARGEARRRSHWAWARQSEREVVFRTYELRSPFR